MTFTLDVATLEAVTVLTFAVMAVALAWTWRLHRLNRAMIAWSACFALAALHALSLFSDRSVLSPLAAVADEVTLVLAGFLCWFGFRAFDGRASPYWAMALTAAAATAVIALLPDYRHQTLDAAGLIAMVLSLFSAVAAVRGGSGDRSWRVVACLVLVGHAAFLGIRVLADDASPLPERIAITDWDDVLFLVEPMLLPIVLGYTLLGMVTDEERARSLRAQHTDLLTGALNRRGLEDLVVRADQRAGMALIAFDLDRFKAINDSHGHAVGDVVLSAVVGTVRANLRPGDPIVRMGGEEFLAVMPASQLEDGLQVAERVRAALAGTPVSIPSGSLHITASFGVAALRPGWDRDDLERALVAADSALYAAKQSGRNAVRAAT